MWKLAGIIIAFIAIIGIMAGTHSLTINSVINSLTFVAILVPVIYLVVMLTSKKTTKADRKRVWAYIPLFIAAMLFWSIEEQGSVVLALFASNQTALHGMPCFMVPIIESIVHHVVHTILRLALVKEIA